MLELPERKRPLPFVRNLEAVGERIGRIRAPHAPLPSRRRQQALVVGAIVSAALILLFLFTIDGLSPGWPRDVTKAVRHTFQAITQLGRSNWLLVPSGVLCIALLLADWDRTSRRIAAAWTELGALSGFFFVSIAAAGMTTNFVKWTLGRSRPILFDTDGPYRLTPISFDYSHVSFPSGHTTTAAAAAMALVLIFPGRPWVKVAAVVFAVSIGVSRVMVRAHYPSDVVGGMFVGIAVTILCAHAFGRRGIAFQSQADGTLLPKTVALRGVFAAPGGARRALDALGGAWAAAFRREDAAAVDKRRDG